MSSVYQDLTRNHKFTGSTHTETEKRIKDSEIDRSTFCLRDFVTGTPKEGAGYIKKVLNRCKSRKVNKFKNKSSLYGFLVFKTWVLQ